MENINFATVHARKSDPITSKDAARNAEKFAGTHAGHIYKLLTEYVEGTTDELASRSNKLTSAQIARRMNDLVALGLVCPSGRVKRSDSGCNETIWTVV
tara:strand:+ start:750 stop:1046 length:297 start_codon:yes stop_codon:yes gene_type:complete